MEKKYNNEDGVWRTIGGRRVFIRTGQSLADAMIASGKFKNLRRDYKKAKEEEKMDEINERIAKHLDNVAKVAKEVGDEKNAKTNELASAYARSLIKGKQYSAEDMINAIKQNKMDFEDDGLGGTYSVGEYGNGYYVQFQDRAKHIGTQDIMEHNNSGEKVESNTWLRIWKDKENVLNVEDSKYGARQQAIDYLKKEGYDDLKDEEENTIKYEGLEKYTKLPEAKEKERLDIAKDIAKEVYGLNENNASPERIEKEARRILEPVDGEVLEKGDTPFTNSKGQLERSTKSLKEWRDSLKGNKEEVIKLPDGTPIDQNYIKDIYSGMSYEEVKRENDFDKEWMSKVKPEARPMQAAKVKETEKYLANMERYESRIDDKEYGKKDWGEGVYPFSEGSAWKGTKSGEKLSTTEIAKAVTDKMKEAYPGVNISRKTSYYSGGSSADFSIMSSDKPLIRNINDFSETELNRLYNSGYNSNHYKDVSEFKEALGKRLSSGNIDINKYHIDDNYELTPYGKAVIKDLKKVTDAYNYDESDGMTDYFNTGFYSDISIGKYNKPYEVKSTSNGMNDALRNSAYKKYMKEHPNSKMTLEQFLKKK